MSALATQMGLRIAVRFASTSPRHLRRPDTNSSPKMPGNYLAPFEVML
jgi:hypothetical protein